MTVLLCGGTGALGSAVASGLAERGVGFRALVRPGTDGSALQQLGAHLVVGGLTDPGSLPAAVDGVETVVTTATAIGRLLGGAKNLSALARAKPEVASVMSMALHFDLHGSAADSRPLEQLGITPRSTSAYIAQLAAAG